MPSHEDERAYQPETSSQQIQTSEAQPDPWEETPPKKSKKPILIGASTLTLLAVAAIVVLALMLNGDSPARANLESCDTWLRQQLVEFAAGRGQRRKCQHGCCLRPVPASQLLPTRCMEPVGNECLPIPRGQHRHQFLHCNREHPRHNGDDARGRHATLGLHSHRKPVVLVGRRQLANLGRAAHWYTSSVADPHATPTTNRETGSGLHAHAPTTNDNALHSTDSVAKRNAHTSPTPSPSNYRHTDAKPLQATANATDHCRQYPKTTHRRNYHLPRTTSPRERLGLQRQPNAL